MANIRELRRILSEEELINLSDVKRRILERLSDGEWTSSTELLNLTGQKYFDRRIRELRDELGLVIHMEKQSSEPYYRIDLTHRNPPKPRTYLAATEKKEMLSNSQSICNLCGKNFDQTLLVLDHRVPLIRGGGGSKKNFQVICRECNNQKRTQCRGCVANCVNCFLAFPEKYSSSYTVTLTEAEEAELSRRSAQMGLSNPETLLKLIKDELS
jgi:5-methylcytosine-specific restriction endonuclease McrA